MFSFQNVKQTTIGFIEFSLTHVEKLKNKLFYYVFVRKSLKNNWFHSVVAQQCWKTCGFIMFPFKDVKKQQLVLLCVCRQMRLTLMFEALWNKKKRYKT